MIKTLLKAILFSAVLTSLIGYTAIFYHGMQSTAQINAERTEALGKLYKADYAKLVWERKHKCQK